MFYDVEISEEFKKCILEGRRPLGNNIEPVINSNRDIYSKCVLSESIAICDNDPKKYLNEIYEKFVVATGKVYI